MVNFLTEMIWFSPGLVFSKFKFSSSFEPSV